MKRIRSRSPSVARSVGPGDAAVVGPGRVGDAGRDLDRPCPRRSPSTRAACGRPGACSSCRSRSRERSRSGRSRWRRGRRSRRRSRRASPCRRRPCGPAWPVSAAAASCWPPRARRGRPGAGPSRAARRAPARRRRRSREVPCRVIFLLIATEILTHQNHAAQATPTYNRPGWRPRPGRARRAVPRPARGRRLAAARRARDAPASTGLRRRRLPAGPADQRRRGARARGRAATRRCSTARAGCRATCASCASRRSGSGSTPRPRRSAAVLRHLGMYKIGREVEVADRSDEARDRLGDRPRLGLAHRDPTARRPRARTVRSSSAASPAAPSRPTSGSTWSARRPTPRAVTGALEAAGVVGVSEEAAEIVRVESGRPRFGCEMGTADDPPGGGHQRACRQLHQGLLHRPGDGRPAALQGQAEPPSAWPAPGRDGRRRRSDRRRRARGRGPSGPSPSPPRSARSRWRSCGARPSPATRSRSATASPPRSSSFRSRHGHARRRRPGFVVGLRSDGREGGLWLGQAACGRDRGRWRCAVRGRLRRRRGLRQRTPAGGPDRGHREGRRQEGRRLAQELRRRAGQLHGLQPVRRPGDADPGRPQP